MSICGPACDTSWMTPGDRDWDAHPVPDCYGHALDGPEACTCWEPAYDRRQRRTVAGPMPIRTAMCADCAYRPQSREYQAAGGPPDHATFVCHQGLRRVVTWRHPDGRVRQVGEGYEAHYDPPVARGQTWRTDGQPASFCAGWAALTGRRPR